MAPNTLGMSDYDKEMAKWNAPYRYQEFPKMLYRGRTSAAGRAERDERTVETAREEQDARRDGWVANPDEAVQAEIRRQELIGTASAERAYTDARMSPQAQREAAAADQAAGARHLGAIPEQPRPPTRKRIRPSRAKAKTTPKETTP